MGKLDKQWEYYKSKEEEFLKNCYGKFLVINEKLEVVVMDTIGDAYKLGCLAFGLGNFLIQECVEEISFDTYIREVVAERTSYGYKIYRVKGKDDSGKRVCKKCKKELPLEKYNKWNSDCCDECVEKILKKYRVPEKK